MSESSQFELETYVTFTFKFGIFLQLRKVIAGIIVFTITSEIIVLHLK